MSFESMLIKTGAYTQKPLDTDNNKINEYVRTTDTESSLIKFEDFDFDQNGAVDYRRSYSYTAEGKETYETFYSNSPENNEKIYEKEPSFFEKTLRFLGFETKATLSDLDVEKIREEADALTASYVAKYGEEKEKFAEAFEITKQELEKVKATIAENTKKYKIRLN